VEIDLEETISRHLNEIQIFRAQFIKTVHHFKRRNLGKVNIAEFAVITACGDSRLPRWMKTIESLSIFEEFPLQPITLHDLVARFVLIKAELELHRIVPKTKSQLLASYLAGTTCATAESLRKFASITKTTAHSWLNRCVEHKLLDVFETRRDKYFLNPALMQLALIGHSDSRSIFYREYLDDLAMLRRRKNYWLATSKLVVRFAGDLRRYEAS
jgi:hypothetical protein